MRRWSAVVGVVILAFVLVGCGEDDGGDVRSSGEASASGSGSASGASGSGSGSEVSAPGDRRARRGCHRCRGHPRRVLDHCPRGAGHGRSSEHRRRQRRRGAPRGGGGPGRRSRTSSRRARSRRTAWRRCSGRGDRTLPRRRDLRRRVRARGGLALHPLLQHRRDGRGRKPSRATSRRAWSPQWPPSDPPAPGRETSPAPATTRARASGPLPPGAR